MKTNKNLATDKKAENLKIKNEKKKEEEENEEEEDDEEEEEEEEEPKVNTQKNKPIQLLKSINKEPKIPIITKEEKSPLLSSITNSFNKQTILNSHNQENNTSKEGISIRKALQEKKNRNQAITANPSILAKKDLLKIGKSHPYTIKLNPISPRTQIKAQNNEENQKTKISNNLGDQPETSKNQTKYSGRTQGSALNNNEDNNNKEIKIINKNNNYTINVTNNNTINVTNNSNNNEENNSNNNIYNNENKEDDKEEEINKEKIKYKKEIKKEPRIDIKKEKREDKEDIKNNLTMENNLENENENNIQENENSNNNKEKNSSLIKLNIKEENNKKEYVTNDILIQNGVEIYKFSPEETKKVLEKVEELKELKKNKGKIKIIRKNTYNNNNSQRPSYGNFYQRGRDNFSKRIIRERDDFYKRDKYQDDYDDSFDYDDGNNNYTNRTFNGFDNYNDNKRDYRNDNRFRRFNNFYDRGRPNPVSRGFRGRRGRF